MRKKTRRKSVRAAKRTIPKSDTIVEANVTIDDFANASCAHSRITKAAANVTSQALVEEPVETGEEDPSEMSEAQSARGGRRRGCAAKTEDADEQDEGVCYPLDVWLLISTHIAPEAVGKFARICRSAYHVTTTAAFWLHLYKAYYRPVAGMPERLQPHCMVIQHGLRACAIRALYLCYFATRPDYGLKLAREEPHALVKRQCCLMWHKEGKGRWYFYFKLRELSKKRSRTDTGRRGRSEFLEMLEDVAVNPEEGCKVLQVIASKYSLLPPVNGLYLQEVSCSLMPGLTGTRIRLGFGTSHVSRIVACELVLTDVINHHVLDWWHPCYPHQDRIPTIELPPVDSWD